MDGGAGAADKHGRRGQNGVVSLATVRACLRLINALNSVAVLSMPLIFAAPPPSWTRRERESAGDVCVCVCRSLLMLGWASAWFDHHPSVCSADRSLPLHSPFELKHKHTHTHRPVAELVRQGVELGHADDQVCVCFGVLGCGWVAVRKSDEAKWEGDMTRPTDASIE